MDYRLFTHVFWFHKMSSQLRRARPGVLEGALLVGHERVRTARLLRDGVAAGRTQRRERPDGRQWGK